MVWCGLFWFEFEFTALYKFRNCYSLTSGLHIGVAGVFVLIGMEVEGWTRLSLYQ